MWRQHSLRDAYFSFLQRNVRNTPTIGCAEKSDYVSFLSFMSARPVAVDRFSYCATGSGMPWSGSMERAVILDIAVDVFRHTSASCVRASYVLFSTHAHFTLHWRNMTGIFTGNVDGRGPEVRVGDLSAISR